MEFCRTLCPDYIHFSFVYAVVAKPEPIGACHFRVHAAGAETWRHTKKNYMNCRTVHDNCKVGTRRQGPWTGFQTCILYCIVRSWPCTRWAPAVVARPRRSRARTRSRRGWMCPYCLGWSSALSAEWPSAPSPALSGVPAPHLYT